MANDYLENINDILAYEKTLSIKQKEKYDKCRLDTEDIYCDPIELFARPILKLSLGAPCNPDGTSLKKITNEKTKVKININVFGEHTTVEPLNELDIKFFWYVHHNAKKRVDKFELYKGDYKVNVVSKSLITLKDLELDIIEHNLIGKGYIRYEIESNDNCIIEPLDNNIKIEFDNNIDFQIRINGTHIDKFKKDGNDICIGTPITFSLNNVDDIFKNYKFKLKIWERDSWFTEESFYDDKNKYVINLKKGESENWHVGCEYLKNRKDVVYDYPYKEDPGNNEYEYVYMLQIYKEESNKIISEKFIEKRDYQQFLGFIYRPKLVNFKIENYDKGEDKEFLEQSILLGVKITGRFKHLTSVNQKFPVNLMIMYRELNTEDIYLYQSIKNVKLNIQKDGKFIKYLNFCVKENRTDVGIKLLSDKEKESYVKLRQFINRDYFACMSFKISNIPENINIPSRIEDLDREINADKTLFKRVTFDAKNNKYKYDNKGNYICSSPKPEVASNTWLIKHPDIASVLFYGYTTNQRAESINELKTFLNLKGEIKKDILGEKSPWLASIMSAVYYVGYMWYVDNKKFWPPRNNFKYIDHNYNQRRNYSYAYFLYKRHYKEFKKAIKILYPQTPDDAIKIFGKNYMPTNKGKFEDRVALPITPSGVKMLLLDIIEVKYNIEYKNDM